MDQLTGNQAADLCKHVDQNGILHHIPVIGCQHILTALIQNGVQYLAGDIECHGIGTGVKMHVVEVFKIIKAGQNPARSRIVLEVVEDPVHLIHISLRVVVLHRELIAVGLADGAALIGPLIPDM